MSIIGRSIELDIIFVLDNSNIEVTPEARQNKIESCMSKKPVKCYHYVGTALCVAMVTTSIDCEGNNTHSWQNCQYYKILEHSELSDQFQYKVTFVTVI